MDRFEDGSVMGFGGKGLGMMIYALGPVEHLEYFYVLGRVYR